MEGETAEWMVSLWPSSLGEIPLEDRRAAADMLVIYGEWAAANMLAYSAIAWCAAFIFSRIFKPAAKGKDPGSLDSGRLRSG
jgi:hypothetical protein